MDIQQINDLKAQAVTRHSQNHNCAQCVACTLAELGNYSQEDAFRFMEGFGGGMGNFTQTCGALSGAVFAVSAKSSDGYENRTTKQTTYTRESQLQSAFIEKFGATTCKELRPSQQELIRPTCEGYIAGAVELALASLEAIEA